jgi:aspartate kinase
LNETSPLKSLQTLETEFEKKRGISSVDSRLGYAQVHISNLLGNVPEARLRVMSALADAGISIDFLKLTPTGLSFLVKNEEGEVVARTVKDVAVDCSIRPNQAIVLVHAVNIRDEEGLVGDIVCAVIGAGIEIQHTGDMHDRLLLVVSESVAQETISVIRGLGGNS